MTRITYSVAAILFAATVAAAFLIGIQFQKSRDREAISEIQYAILGDLSLRSLELNFLSTNMTPKAIEFTLLRGDADLEEIGTAIDEDPAIFRSSFACEIVNKPAVARFLAFEPERHMIGVSETFERLQKGCGT